jgi:hypothetical protein
VYENLIRCRIIKLNVSLILYSSDLNLHVTESHGVVVNTITSYSADHEFEFWMRHWLF